MNSRLLFPLLANLSITLFLHLWQYHGEHEEGQVRWVFPLSLYFFSHVFNLLKVEKLHSTDATLTDKVMRVCNSTKISALQLCFHEVSSILVYLHCFLSNIAIKLYIFWLLWSGQIHKLTRRRNHLLTIALTSHKSYQQIVVSSFLYNLLKKKYWA